MWCKAHAMISYGVLLRDFVKSNHPFLFSRNVQRIDTVQSYSHQGLGEWTVVFIPRRSNNSPQAGPSARKNELYTEGLDGISPNPDRLAAAHHTHKLNTPEKRVRPTCGTDVTIISKRLQTSQPLRNAPHGIPSQGRTCHS